MVAHIKIDDLAPRRFYEVGGTPQAAFDVPFPFFSTADLKVYVDGVLKTLGTDYTVAGVVVDAGFESGTVTFTSAVTNVGVSITRDVPIKRTSDFPNSGPFSIPALNTDIDKIIAILQQQRSRIDRSIHLPDSDPLETMVLPADRANKYLFFDASGAAIVAAAPVVSVAATDVATQASLVGVQMLAASLYLRTAGYSAPGDYGGGLFKRVASEPSHDGKVRSADRYLPNGTTDNANGGWWELSATIVTPHLFGGVDTTAFNKAITYLNAIGGGTLYVPPGTYNTTSIVMKSNVTVDCASGVVFNVTGSDSNKAVSFEGATVDPAYNLTVTAGRNAEQITLLASDAATFAGAELIVLRDSNFTAEPFGRNQEQVRPKSIVGGVITLQAPIVSTYLIGDTAQVIKLNACQDAHWRGGKFLISRNSLAKTIATTSGSPIVSVNSTSGLQVGMVCESVNISPTGAKATILSINTGASTVTLNGNATATASGTSASFHLGQGGGFFFDNARNCTASDFEVQGASNLPAYYVGRSFNCRIIRPRALDGQCRSIASHGYGGDIDDSSIGIVVDTPFSQGMRENVISNRARHITIRNPQSFGDVYNAWNTHSGGCAAILIDGGQFVGTLLGPALSIGYLDGYTNDGPIIARGVHIKRAARGAVQISGSQTAAVPYTNDAILLDGIIVDGFGQSVASTAFNIFETDRVRVTNCFVRDGAVTSGNKAFEINDCNDGQIDGLVVEGVNGTAFQMEGCIRMKVNLITLRNITGNAVVAGNTNNQCEIINCTTDSGTISINALVFQSNNSWLGRRQSGRASVQIPNGATENSVAVTVALQFPMPNANYKVLFGMDRNADNPSPGAHNYQTGSFDLTLKRAGTTGTVTFTVPWEVVP